MDSNLFKLKNNEISTVYTHAGKFHADDVLSTALLMLINPELTIKRVNNNYLEENSLSDDNAVIYDIGYGKFDHHQLDNEVRHPDEETIELQKPYAAFGKLWRELGSYLVGETQVQKFDDTFVSLLDLTDNTGIFNSFAYSINSFIPNWDEDRDMDEAFNIAVEFAKKFLVYQVSKMKSVEKAKIKVLDYYENNKTFIDEDSKEEYTISDEICVLEEYLPWTDAIIPTNCKFVIYPSARQENHWNLSPVEKNFEDRNNFKQSIPECLWGADIEVLQEHVQGLCFVHKSHGFIADFKGKDNAIAGAMMFLTKWV